MEAAVSKVDAAVREVDPAKHEADPARFQVERPSSKWLWAPSRCFRPIRPEPAKFEIELAN